MEADKLIEIAKEFRSELDKVPEKVENVVKAAKAAKEAKEAEETEEDEKVEEVVKGEAAKAMKVLRNEARSKLQDANIKFSELRAFTIGMGEFARQFDCSKIMSTEESDARNKEMKRQIKHSINRLGPERVGEDEQIANVRTLLEHKLKGGGGGHMELAPTALTSREDLEAFYNAFAAANGNGDNSVFEGLFKQEQSSNESDKKYDSEWIVMNTDGTDIKRAGLKKFADDSLGGKNILKCMVMGSVADLEQCLASNVDEDLNEIVTHMSRQELQLLFKKFEVPYTTLPSGIQVPSKQWGQWAKGKKFPENVTAFVLECINMCNQPSNYPLLNDSETIDCYKAQQKKLQEANCNTMRLKGNMPTAPSSLCASMSPYNVGMPMMIAGLTGGGVKFVNNSNSMGRFLLSGGASFKQSGGDCCADRYKKLLNSVKNTLASRGVKINGQDLRKLERTIDGLTAGEEQLIKLQQKVQHFANQRSLLNCGVPKTEVNVGYDDIFKNPENLDKVFEKNLEECQKDMTNLLQSQNQLYGSQFIPGINALLQSQPLQYLSP
jgi:hypothetical protein